ncbi:MAG: hypothetical protein MJZ68_05325 [archaeon]|nr:hypothetical protein [archaeon]
MASVKKMTPRERAFASLAGEPVDQIPFSPLTCGNGRKVMTNPVTYRQICEDPHLFAEQMTAASRAWHHSLNVGLLDLSIASADYGAELLMVEENTPATKTHVPVTGPETYDKIGEGPVPDVHKGRTKVLVEGSIEYCNNMKNQDLSVGVAFVEGSLLSLSQTVGMEQLCMDMLDDGMENSILKALDNTTQYTVNEVDAFAAGGVEAVCVDDLLASEDIMGDQFYKFCGNMRFAGKINNAVTDQGMALAIHNCSCMPMVEHQTQDEPYRNVSVYSHAWYPGTDGTLSAPDFIERTKCRNGAGKPLTGFGCLDPQLLSQADPQVVFGAAKDFVTSVKTSLCKAGLSGAMYHVSPGCEVPPGLASHPELLSEVQRAIDTYGTM